MLCCVLPARQVVPYLMTVWNVILISILSKGTGIARHDPHFRAHSGVRQRVGIYARTHLKATTCCVF